LKKKFKNYYLNRFLLNLYFNFRLKKINIAEENYELEKADKVLLDKSCLPDEDILVGLVKDTDPCPYYTKFRRFLRNNNINFDYYNIFNSNWMEEAEKFDIIIWRPMSSPWELEDAREKFYVLEQELNKLVFPSYRDLLIYENKVMQYYFLKKNNLPAVDTYIFYSYDEAMDFIKTADYPMVSKIKTGSGSSGVRMIKNYRSAKKLISNTFRGGEKTYWPFIKQKNVVLLQKYIPSKFDLRVNVFDSEHIFGYYRYPEKNDFRASGFYNIERKELPLEAVKIALKVREKLNVIFIDVDFVQSLEDNKYYIIEFSYFNRIIRCERVILNGVPGGYRYDKDMDSLYFEEGRYWLQELMLKRFFETHKF
jgi:glutathione synthase/RimK-type ligase-like ATP-grasp enzyme